MKNKINELFREFKKNKIDYCVIRKYQFLPKKLIGDLDLAIAKKDLKRAIGIIEKEKFLFYPFTEPHFFYFFYDEEVGLIKLDLVAINELPKTVNYRGFPVLKNGEKFRIQKGFFHRIYTNIRRKIRYFLKGRLFCFVGPDGSGKSTLIKEVNNSLKELGIKKEIVYFGTRRGGKIIRSGDLIKKILKIYWNKLTGKMTLTDRYIYLTFRKKTFLKRLIRFIAPTPDGIFLMMANPQHILKRKKELTEKEILEQYRLFNSVPNLKRINTEKSVKEDLKDIIDEILERYLV